MSVKLYLFVNYFKLNGFFGFAYGSAFSYCPFILLVVGYVSTAQ